jgi:hypothetical protein
MPQRNPAFCTSSLQEFTDAVDKAGQRSQVVCLDRGDVYKFAAKSSV